MIKQWVHTFSANYQELPKNVREKVGLYRDYMDSARSKSHPDRSNRSKNKYAKPFQTTTWKLASNFEANKKVADFLDVTLDMNKGTYKPFIKPNNTPLYVHHVPGEQPPPPFIIRNIPAALAVEGAHFWFPAVAAFSLAAGFRWLAWCFPVIRLYSPLVFRALQLTEILCRTWLRVKCLFTTWRKVFATFVMTFWLNGGLNQMIFRVSLFFPPCS